MSKKLDDLTDSQLGRLIVMTTTQRILATSFVLALILNYIDPGKIHNVNLNINMITFVVIGILIWCKDMDKRISDLEK